MTFYLIVTKSARISNGLATGRWRGFGFTGLGSSHPFARYRETGRRNPKRERNGLPSRGALRYLERQQFAGVIEFRHLSEQRRSERRRPPMHFHQARTIPDHHRPRNSDKSDYVGQPFFARIDRSSARKYRPDGPVIEFVEEVGGKEGSALGTRQDDWRRQRQKSSTWIQARPESPVLRG